jgi:hypothetical protein
MGLIKLMFLSMRMLTWPVMAPLRMMMWPFKVAFRFVTVMLLLAQLMVTLFLTAMFVIFTVVPTIMVGLYGLYWVMKKMRMGRIREFGKVHMRMPSPRRFNP